jgi:hypothetical protein
MSAPAISCEVFVDGARLADTGDAWQAGTPTALSGLSTKWGRDGPQDQPDAATCSLTVADKDGDTEFLSVLYVGALLDVYAAALIDAGGPTDVAADGGFGSPIGMRVKADKGTVADDPASDAIAPPGHACKFTLTPDLTAAGWLTVPPAPFTTHPGGWLTVPQISPGEAWTMSIRVKVGPVPPPQLAIQIVGFRDSLSQWGDQLANGPTIAGAAGQYVTVTVPWTVDAYIKPGTYWLGLAVNNITPAKYNQAPAGLTYAATPPGSYGDCRCLWVDDFHLMAPAVTQRRGHVFTGRITDLTATAMAGQAVAVDVIAVDWIADLANQNIGDAPWLAERLDARAARILNKTNVGTGALPVAYIDARCARMLVSWQDVDNQPIYGLMEDLAVSGDGILWPIGYRVLWVEDPETRGSTGTFGPDPGGSGLITVTASRPTGGVVLDSCDVLQDGLELGQTAGDVINRVSLTWLDQTLDEAGKPAPTDITIYVDDTSAGADALGVRCRQCGEPEITALSRARVARVRFELGYRHRSGRRGNRHRAPALGYVRPGRHAAHRHEYAGVDPARPGLVILAGIGRLPL